MSYYVAVQALVSPPLPPDRAVEDRLRLAVSPAVPADLRAALKEDYALITLPDDRVVPDLRVAVTTSMAGCSAAQMALLPSLGLIACNGVGLDRIDLDVARSRAIRVCNTPDVLTEDVAESAIALMLALVRRVAEADRFVRAGRWRGERMTLSRRIAGRRMGIVGLGRIGGAVARRAVGLGLEVAYYGRSVRPDTALPRAASLLELAATSDIIVLCAPGGPGTDGMIDRAIFDALGRDGYLVNIARGALVDETALLDALEAGRIAGAALDVFVNEPSVDPRFFALDNVVLQPHSSALTHETRAAMIAILRDAIATFFARDDGSQA